MMRIGSIGLKIMCYGMNLCIPAKMIAKRRRVLWTRKEVGRNLCLVVQLLNNLIA